MKQRVRSLDGLRGFAALSVLLSHVGFLANNSTAVIGFGVIRTAYQLFATGPNSVQILFVLSGFLMASLYPRISNIKEFIQKRYARIFPVYGVIIVYLWIAILEQLVKPWYLQVVLLLVIAVFARVVWLTARRKIPSIGAKFFWIFIVLQGFVLLVNVFITPKLFSLPNLPDFFKNALYALTDLTLTTPFTKEFKSIVAVFWSLAPEVMFYITYPFLVLPLIQIAKKWGTLPSILLIFAITKILLDLDKAFISYAGMQVINIARAEGFVVGVFIGTIYLAKGKIWNRIEPFFANTFVNIIVLSFFLFMQWADVNIHGNLTTTDSNWYFIISSWVIGGLLIASLINNTLINRIFRSKYFVFLGSISYSLYLIHLPVMGWVTSFFAQVGFQTSTVINSFVYLLTSLLFSILIAFILFQLIESLYFKSKLEKKQRQSLQITEPTRVKNTGPLSLRYISISFFSIIMILVLSYSGGYASSLLVARHSLSSNAQMQLLSSNMEIPIIAQYSNLSEIVINMDYKKSTENLDSKLLTPSKLLFRLFDEKHTLIFTSERSARQVEGEPRFPFGFPSIAESKGHKYLAVLSFVGKSNEKIFVDTSPSSVVSIYTNSKTGFVKFVELFINRFVFITTNVDALFAIGIFAFLLGFAKFNKINLQKERNVKKVPS